MNDIAMPVTLPVPPCPSPTKTQRGSGHARPAPTTTTPGPPPAPSAALQGRKYLQVFSVCLETHQALLTVFQV